VIARCCRGMSSGARMAFASVGRVARARGDPTIRLRALRLGLRSPINLRIDAGNFLAQRGESARVVLDRLLDVPCERAARTLEALAKVAELVVDLERLLSPRLSLLRELTIGEVGAEHASRDVGRTPLDLPLLEHRCREPAERFLVIARLGGGVAVLRGELLDQRDEARHRADDHAGRTHRRAHRERLSRDSCE